MHLSLKPLKQQDSQFNCAAVRDNGKFTMLNVLFTFEHRDAQSTVCTKAERSGLLDSHFSHKIF